MMTMFAVESVSFEEWRDIPGYTGLYQVSNRGRIKSLRKNGLILRPYMTGKGAIDKRYPTVDLQKRGHKVHRIVAEAFIQNPHWKRQVNHMDGIKTNNGADNLEWCTNRENQIHAVRLELAAVGERNPFAKLTREAVRTIRKIHILSDPVYGTKPLARRYGVSQSTIKNIVCGRKWKCAYD
jgi:hypothetical protein